MAHRDPARPHGQSPITLGKRFPEPFPSPPGADTLLRTTPPDIDPGILGGEEKDVTHG